MPNREPRKQIMNTNRECNVGQGRLTGRGEDTTQNAPGTWDWSQGCSVLSIL